MCSLCNNAVETSSHLFLSCPFACRIWCGLSQILDRPVDLSSFTSALGVCNSGWGLQVWDVVLAAVLNVFSTIWFCRNKLHFDNKNIALGTATNQIRSLVSLAGNSSKGTMSSSIPEFCILKFFAISGHPPTSRKSYGPPACTRVKCNTDGAARGAPGWSSCGGIFRDYHASILGCFAANLGISFSLHAELTGAMMAIEHASQEGWNHFWLESDSQLVVGAFHNPSIVP